jgi:hypothetical protein
MITHYTLYNWNGIDVMFLQLPWRHVDECEKIQWMMMLRYYFCVEGKVFVVVVAAAVVAAP